MTRIDFHSNIPDKIGYVCRLIRKARSSDCKIVVTGDATQLGALDDALWRFSEQDFLPHVLADDPLAPQTAILLAGPDDDTLPHHQVLINLCAQTPSHFARYERLLEIVSTDRDDIGAGRDRYRFYQQRGYPITHVVAQAA